MINSMMAAEHSYHSDELCMRYEFSTILC